MTDQPSSKPAVPLRIFVADDDREMRRMIAESLRRDGHFVLEASDGAVLLDELAHAFYGDQPEGSGSLIISDVSMPGRDGLEVLRRMRTHSWCPPFILITAFGDPSLHAEARQLGAQAVLDKPFDMATLRAAVIAYARSRVGG
jgi:two-component system, response regulator, stage 0 sporulation protein F